VKLKPKPPKVTGNKESKMAESSSNDTPDEDFDYTNEDLERFRIYDDNNEPIDFD